MGTTTLKNKNSIQEDNKSSLKSGNACYHSVQNILSSSLLSKKKKDEDIQNDNFACCFYGCENWSLTVKQIHRQRMFENGVLRRIFGPKKNYVTGE